MTKRKSQAKPNFGTVSNTQEIGGIIRAFRKQKGLSLEQVSGLTNIGMRFISEFERGKETAQIGKVLELLNSLGLEVLVWPRGSNVFTPGKTEVKLF